MQTACPRSELTSEPSSTSVTVMGSMVGVSWMESEQRITRMSMCCIHIGRGPWSISVVLDIPAQDMRSAKLLGSATWAMLSFSILRARKQ